MTTRVTVDFKDEPDVLALVRERARQAKRSVSAQILHEALGSLTKPRAVLRDGPKLAKAPGPKSKLPHLKTKGEFAASAAGCGASPGVALGGATPGNARKVKPYRNANA